MRVRIRQIHGKRALGGVSLLDFFNAHMYTILSTADTRLRRAISVCRIYNLSLSIYCELAITF